MGWPPLARREHRPSAGLLRFATPTPTPVFQPGGGAAMSRVAGVPDRLQAPAAQSLAGLYRFGSGVRPTRRRLVDVGRTSASAACRSTDELPNPGSSAGN